MRTERVFEHGHIPIQVEKFEKGHERFQIDPKHSGIKVFRRRRIVIERFLQLVRPIDRVTFRVVAFPAHVSPRIFEKQQLSALSIIIVL